MTYARATYLRGEVTVTRAETVQAHRAALLGPGHHAVARGGVVLSWSYEVPEAIRAELRRVRNVKPLWSRFGTVLGVMDAFLGIAAGGSGNISAVAPGVAEALITTVAGLATAIPAVIAYNIFVNRLGLFAGELEGFANELIGSMAREGLI